MRILATLAMLAVFAIGTSGTLAARPQPMRWSAYYWPFPQQPVEQQTPVGATQPDRSLWIVNPYAYPLPQSEWCVWDSDDRIMGGFGGIIGPGVTVSGSACVILDQVAHEAWITVSDPRLVGLVTVDGVSGQCVFTPEFDNDEVSDLPEIEGSNGGHGLKTAITWSIHNPTNRTIRHEIALTGIEWQTTVEPCGDLQS